ncbi:MAG TPA: energy transducer TonB [Candidatus Acidoferrum sp.]|nr:energy transducer TonB [Candidatus Acidoferrum sp.]
MRSVLRLSFLPLVLCLPASSFSQTKSSQPAQQTPQASAAVSAQSGAPGDGHVAEWMYGEHIPAVPGLPFSAKVELETVNQLQNGTLITHKTYNLDARDAEGRTRNEARNWIDLTTGAEPRLTRIELYDPATRLRTNLYLITKIARQWPMGTPGPIPAPSPQSSPAKPETTRENIGTDTIEGLPVRGVRVSQTYPTGALGNDRPLTVVTEYWYSESLRLNLLTKRSDPRYGEQTVRVTELVRQEPDASLFAIPDDYKLLKETVQQTQSPGSPGDSSGPLPPGVARAGIGGVTQPRCTYCPNPSYSEDARAARVQGSVILSVIVSATGQVDKVTALRGPGHGLEQQAAEVVQNWRFTPATGSDGKPVACIVTIEVTFRLA